MDRELQQIEAAVSRFSASDPNLLTDPELTDQLVALHQLGSRIEALAAQRAAIAQSRQLHRADRYRSAASWLSERAHTSKPAARRVLRLGRFCRDMELIGEAWRSGEIDTEHVRIVAAAHSARTDAAMRDQQKLLVDTAATISRFTSFERAIRYWTNMADTDGPEPPTDEQLSRNQFTMGRASDGTLLGKFQLDTIGGAIVEGSLREIYEELFKKEWAETRARLGRDPLVSELPRTDTQRRAAALVEMARRARTAPKDGRRPRPLVTICKATAPSAARVNCPTAKSSRPPPPPPMSARPTSNAFCSTPPPASSKSGSEQGSSAVRSGGPSSYVTGTAKVPGATNHQNTATSTT